MPKPAENHSDEEAASVLVLQTGDRQIELTSSPALAGRLGGLAIELALRQISRRHAEFRCDRSGQWSVSDKRSSGGTYVNDQRLALDAQLLKAGDSILLADIELRVIQVCALVSALPTVPGDEVFASTAGREAGGALGQVHTYRIRPLTALGAEDVAQALTLVLDLSRQLARADL